jgi:ribose-phosphate pyrophosphokinase
LYTEQVQGFFNIPVDNLYACLALVGAVRKLQPNQVVTPDVGSVSIAYAFAEKLDIGFSVINKRCINANEVESTLTWRCLSEACFARR